MAPLRLITYERRTICINKKLDALELPDRYAARDCLFASIDLYYDVY